MAAIRQILTYQGIPVWRHARVIQWTLQIVSGVVVVALVIWFFANIGNAIQDRDIPYGFSFLSREYQTPIGEHFIPYESSDTFLYAFGVAVSNTLIVSISGVILATILGTLVGIARLSSNWLVSRLALAYIEFFRNVPLLVQLLFWFFIVLTLPIEREAYNIANSIYISNSGVSMSWPSPTGIFQSVAWVALVVAGIFAGLAVNKTLSRRETLTGRSSYPLAAGWATAVIVGAAGWIVIGMIAGEAPFAISIPEPSAERFGRLVGGFTVRAGLMTALVGLVMYTASFIAEIVRAGIQSVGRGQTEAARALGLSPVETLRNVTFPQALRVIIPPLISQCLNLTKNSSLSGAVGYSDLASVSLTMTQTAPAVSIFMMLMAAYLAMSLTWSLIGNLYNRRVGFSGG